MKKKYFFRGLGTGIIFCAIIMLASYMTSGGYKMSDEDVIKRAQKLGMEMTTSVAQPESTEDNTEKQTTEKNTTEEKTSEEVTEATTEEKTSEEVTETTTEEIAQTTEETTTETQNDGVSGTKATITVSGGMSSETISALLEDAGLIDSASDFNSYLVKNGYDSKLETGSFSIEADMTYEQIAKILTKQ